jgi:hypothetical protein
MKMFYNNNHIRDGANRIIKRDYTTFEAVECSMCHNPILGTPAFSHHGKPHLLYGLGAGFSAPLTPFIDLGNIDYCKDCKKILDYNKKLCIFVN